MKNHRTPWMICPVMGMGDPSRATPAEVLV